jgi:hypothetical protein
LGNGFGLERDDVDDMVVVVVVVWWLVCKDLGFA